ncbi:MAG: hypothetical protein KKH44_08770 [Bacteroidetes bacterium]|nr:hypothetical protein [Bacteroidota bacterium]
MSDKIYSFDEMLDNYSSSREATAILLRMWFESEEKRVEAQQEATTRHQNEIYWRKEAEKFERFWREKNN